MPIETHVYAYGQRDVCTWSEAESHRVIGVDDQAKQDGEAHLLLLDRMKAKADAGDFPTFEKELQSGVILKRDALAASDAISEAALRALKTRDRPVKEIDYDWINLRVAYLIKDVMRHMQGY